MVDHIEIAIVQMPHAKGLALPKYETNGSAGMDLVAALEEGETISVAPGERRLVPTGLRIALPDGYEAQVRPRSGLALKRGITLLNTPGTIDSDYRGEIGLILINHGQETFQITRGERLAQLVIARFAQAQWLKTDDLDDTSRGAGGFGSTGTTS